MESDKQAQVPGGDSQAWLAGLNRAILDSALDCIITIDASGRVLEFNPAHRGSIRAFSDGPGKGAKFVIDLETVRDAA